MRASKRMSNSSASCGCCTRLDRQSQSELNATGVSYHKRNEHRNAMEQYVHALRSQVRQLRHLEEVRAGSIGLNRRVKRRLSQRMSQEETAVQEAKLVPLRSARTSHNQDQARLLGMSYFSKPLETGNSADESSDEFGDKCNAIILFNISLVHLETKNLEAAATFLEFARHTVGSSSSVEASTSLLKLMISGNLGYVFYLQEQYEQANTMFEDVVRLGRNVLDSIRKSEGVVCSSARQAMCFLLMALINLARSYDRSGCTSDALAIYDEAEMLGNTMLDVFDAGCLDINLFAMPYIGAQIYQHKADYDKSIELYQLCLQQCREQPQCHLEEEAAALRGLGEVYFEQKHFDQSLQAFLLALGIWTNECGEESKEVADMLFAIGYIQYKREEYTDSLHAFEKVLKIHERAGGISHNETLKTLCMIAQVHRMRNELWDALMACKDILRLAEQHQICHPMVADVLRMEGALVHELGRTDMAETVLADAASLADAHDVKVEEITLAASYSCIQMPSDPAAAAA
eukprot:CAMPEP_0183298012 /NCGR_PEP_ID=MMETSP0160_2-20130417/5143_1 /TAXON_ID=2839 ORGANISM="Odontella Sinensis, Strain Grunow 1884" /NCGR_SAMPLE_ID=MMETSP0160_2 /ASSEMBLY_ACC=CAM_ASM_000250 /LENGTH=517 /DNA_ID=CAMNT_0025459943 /DNA_START=77 /DNA_END=1630 /DNA_ORIENTATION=+